MIVIEVDLWIFGFFFFKQKTAYEVPRGLVGSEMGIRNKKKSKPKKKTIKKKKKKNRPTDPFFVSYTTLTLQKKKKIKI